MKSKKKLIITIICIISIFLMLHFTYTISIAVLDFPLNEPGILEFDEPIEKEENGDGSYTYKIMGNIDGNIKIGMNYEADLKLNPLIRGFVRAVVYKYWKDRKW
mgnify:CR=1 FL=1